MGLAEPPIHLVERWCEEAQRTRRERADWAFINSQPPRLRGALAHYVDMGGPFKASRVAGLSLSEFDELRRRADIPEVP
ncbi:hypothetical protein B6U99_04050 [Candidatus Geothermarchaeota archaeon ex4572_27]|nr:MAG: hypothetical protein B6U99_04050 [Candidatus Geothermarchaeota archaeon ex4572_27]